ncbi:MAG: CPBP family intramembrane glutamic endopeptidase, partial [candidate division WOR-3 bacterium]
RTISPQLFAARSNHGLFPFSAALYVPYFVGYEVLFRGYLLTGVRQRLGNWPALMFSTAATTLLHVSRPGAEYLAAMVAGLVFGYAVVRSRSIWGVVAVHALLGVGLDFFCTFC